MQGSEVAAGLVIDRLTSNSARATRQLGIGFHKRAKRATNDNQTGKLPLSPPYHDYNT
jgi:hypothetical protein